MTDVDPAAAPRHRLVVMRHAKAEPFAATDHERRLTARGHQGARSAGRRLATSGVRPDAALVSSAVRTRETWSDVAAELDGPPDATFDDAWFTGSADVVLDALRELPESVGTVVFVGHNPTAAYLSQFVDDGEGDPEAVAGMLQGFAPGSFTVLELAVPWAGLDAETGRVVDHHPGG